MNNYTDTELELAVQVGALRHACFQCLALLLNGDAEESDAIRVIELLKAVIGDTNAKST